MKELIMLSDEALMERIIQRDKQAFSCLYDRYEGKLLGYMLRMVNYDKDLAQDLLQELFMKIARQPELFDINRSFKAWVYTIAQNLCKMEYRKQARKGFTVPVEDAYKLHDGEKDAAEQFDRKAFQVDVRVALEQIKEPHKSTFMLRFFDELSLKEIANVLDCNEGTVKSRLFYTIRKLAAMLPQYQHL